jgi:hypothetical protein
VWYLNKTAHLLLESKLTGGNEDGWCAETDSAFKKQLKLTWLTRARDSGCAEPSESRPLLPDRSLVPAAHRELQRSASYSLTKARYNSCPKPPKTRPITYMPVTSG